MSSHQPRIAAILSIAAGLSFGAALRTGDASAYALECEENEYGELLEVRRLAGDGDLSAQSWGRFSILRVPSRTFTAYDEQESEAGAIELELARKVER